MDPRAYIVRRRNRLNGIMNNAIQRLQDNDSRQSQHEYMETEKFILREMRVLAQLELIYPS